jgi:hypothetical protein
VPLNAKYVARAASLSSLLTGEPVASVLFAAPDQTGPVSVTIPGRPDVFCLIMPTRAEHSCALLPDWIVDFGKTPAVDETPQDEAIAA